MPNLLVETNYCEFVVCCIYAFITATARVSFPSTAHLYGKLPFLWVSDELKIYYLLFLWNAHLKFQISVLSSEKKMWCESWWMFKVLSWFSIGFYCLNNLSKMEGVITTLGSFGSPSDYLYSSLREIVVLGVIGRSLCSLSREEEVRCSSGLRASEAASGLGHWQCSLTMPSMDLPLQRCA